VCSDFVEGEGGVTWFQRWADVLFLHFPVRADRLRRHLPPALTIDTYDGEAWISYVFFRMTLRPGWLPYMPGFSSLLELNVRTYVRCGDQPGIYFLRMYADNRLAIFASRRLTPLGYEWAEMGVSRDAGGRRMTCWPGGSGGSLEVEFSADESQLAIAASDSLERWLLERYRLYVEDDRGGMVAANVEHEPWQATEAELGKCHNELETGRHLGLDRQPAMAHASPGVTARFDAFSSVASGPARNSRRKKVAGAGFEPTTSRL
jgi:uncharacterized protein YqjF (DUF2071 family)